MYAACALSNAKCAFKGAAVIVELYHLILSCWSDIKEMKAYCDCTFQELESHTCKAGYTRRQLLWRLGKPGFLLHNNNSKSQRQLYSVWWEEKCELYYFYLSESMFASDLCNNKETLHSHWRLIQSHSSFDCSILFCTPWIYLWEGQLHSTLKSTYR